MVAKLCKADLLQEVHDSLQKAREEGQTFQEWRKEILPKLQDRWIGKTVGQLWDELPAEEKDKRLRQKLGDSYDGLSEEEKEKQRAEFLSEKERQKVIEAKRLETIFRVNMRVANAAGHYQALMDKARLYPYWRYNTAEDNRVRESHKILHNKVFRYDDPFWDTHFPPNGWHCRCYVRAMNERDLKRRGVNPEDILDSRNLETITEDSAGGHTKLTYIIDGKKAATADGWNYNPGKVNQQIDSVAEEKAEGYEPELGQQVKDDLKKEEEPKPAAPKPTAKPAAPKSAAAPKPAQPAAAPKPKPADGAHGEPKPAVAPKPAQPAAVPKPAQPAAAPKPKPADGAHGEPKPTAVPKPAQPKPAPVNRPAAPRVVKPVKPADPSVPRIIEPFKPEAKQSILQIIRSKVSRTVDRVLDWLGVPSKQSSFEKLNNGVEKDTYYGSFQPKESQSTVAKNATTAQPQQRGQQAVIVKDNNVPGKSHSNKTQISKQNYDRIIRLHEKTQPIPQTNSKGSVKQQYDKLYAEIEQSGNLPLKWDGKKPVVTLGQNEDDKKVESIAFYQLGYNSVEEAQSAIHNKTLEHAIVFDKDNKCLSETIGRKGDVDFLYHGGAAYLVIHNHPDGTIFSPEDIICAIDNGIHELRVLCNGDGIYAFHPYKDGELAIEPNKVKNELKHWLEQGALASMSTPFPEYDENNPNEIKRANDLWNEKCKHVAQDFVAQHFPGMVKIQ